MRDELTERVRAALRDSPHPVWRFEDGTVLSAANVWSASRQWIGLGRACGLEAGDRVALRAAPCPGFLAALIAGIRERWTIQLLPATAAAEDAQTSGARGFFGFTGGAACISWDDAGNPDSAPSMLARRVAPCPRVRFLLRSSGSTGHPAWFALSGSNVLAVTDSHLPVFGWNSRTRLLSVLPWHHAFGFVLELLAGIFAGAAFLRAAPDSRDMLATARRFNATHFLCVPAHVHRIGDAPGGIELLKSLDGGLIGGAAIDERTAALLRGTRLRCGYGQTEASPGITLGEPGDFEPGLIGLPAGCEIRIAEDGELFFRGANACVGELREDRIRLFEADSWRPTGDLIREENGRLIFCGRKSAGWKLPNGKWMHPFEPEQKLCRELPGVSNALLVAMGPDGRILVLLEADRKIDLRLVADALGGLSNWLEEIRVFPTGALPRSPKGELFRHPPFPKTPVPESVHAMCP